MSDVHMDEHGGGSTEQVGDDLDRRASFILCNNEFLIVERGLLFQPMTLELPNRRLRGDLPAPLEPSASPAAAATTPRRAAVAWGSIQK